MNRRQFTFTALFAGVLGFRGFRKRKPCATPEPVGIFELKFDNNGRANLEELVKRVNWTDEKNGFRHIETDVYLSAESAAYATNIGYLAASKKFYGIVKIWLDEETKFEGYKLYKLNIYPTAKSINNDVKNYGLELNSPAVAIWPYKFSPRGGIVRME